VGESPETDVPVEIDDEGLSANVEVEREATDERIKERWEQRLAKALGAAHLMNGLLVSLLVNECWRVSWLTASRSSLLDSRTCSFCPESRGNCVSCAVTG
jgi:hypothetical protein